MMRHPVGTLVEAQRRYGDCFTLRLLPAGADPEADRFLPERFLGASPDPLVWIPFGGGRRRCLGAPLATLQLMTVVPAVLRRLLLRPVRDRPEKARLQGTALVPRRGVLCRAARVAG